MKSKELAENFSKEIDKFFRKEITIQDLESAAIDASYKFYRDFMDLSKARKAKCNSAFVAIFEEVDNKHRAFLDKLKKRSSLCADEKRRKHEEQLVEYLFPTSFERILKAIAPDLFDAIMTAKLMTGGR